MHYDDLHRRRPAPHHRGGIASGRCPLSPPSPCVAIPLLQWSVLQVLMNFMPWHTLSSKSEPELRAQLPSANGTITALGCDCFLSRTLRASGKRVERHVHCVTLALANVRTRGLAPVSRGALAPCEPEPRTIWASSASTPMG